jgi:hypothetical protein
MNIAQGLCQTLSVYTTKCTPSEPPENRPLVPHMRASLRGSPWAVLLDQGTNEDQCEHPRAKERLAAYNPKSLILLPLPLIQPTM